jgi:hypothetical protein
MGTYGAVTAPRRGGTDEHSTHRETGTVADTATKTPPQRHRVGPPRRAAGDAGAGTGRDSRNTLSLKRLGAPLGSRQRQHATPQEGHVADVLQFVQHRAVDRRRTLAAAHQNRDRVAGVNRLAVRHSVVVGAHPARREMRHLAEPPPGLAGRRQRRSAFIRWDSIRRDLRPGRQVSAAVACWRRRLPSNVFMRRCLPP